MVLFCGLCIFNVHMCFSLIALVRPFFMRFSFCSIPIVKCIRAGTQVLRKYGRQTVRKIASPILYMAVLSDNETSLWEREKIGVAIIGACAFMVVLNRIHKYLSCLRCWEKGECYVASQEDAKLITTF